MLELIKVFSTNYANGLTAFASIGALILSGIALFYVKREYFAKYRPYVIPVVASKRNVTNNDCLVSIIPRNVGPHPCKFMLTDIKLSIGDEVYDTPSFLEWMLLAPMGVGFEYPVGHINEKGISRIRGNQYKKNRIELCFNLHATSIKNQFTSCEEHIFEIDVLGDEPQVLSRPEWIKQKMVEKN